MRANLKPDATKTILAVLTRQVTAAADAVATGDSVSEAIEAVKMNKALAKVWNQAIPVFAGATFNAIEKTLKGYGAGEVVDWVEAADDLIATIGAEKVFLINKTTENYIRRQMRIGVQEGLSVKEVADNIRKKWDEKSLNGLTYGANRAERIASTELVGASNYGSIIGAESTGLDLEKVWLTAGDDVVRDSHREMNGKFANLNEAFSNGMQYPGDMNGGAAEVVRCRCTIYHRVIKK